MGCWNKTCGLSNLPIYGDTPVYVFVLERNPDPHDRCYATSLFRPCLLPFVSTYNSYGGGEDSTGPAFSYIIEALRERLVEMPLGENQYHDIAVTAAEFGEELFFKAVHEGRLFVKGYNEDVPVDFVMFRKDIVDTILAAYEIETYVGNGNGTTGYENSYVRHRYADALTMVPDAVDRIIEAVSPTQSGIFKDLAARHRPGVFSDTVVPAPLGRWIGAETHRYASFLRPRDLLVDLADAGERDQAIAVLSEYLRGIFLDQFISATRKLWVPGCHNGSQNGAGLEYMLLASTVFLAVKAELAENE